MKTPLLILVSLLISATAWTEPTAEQPDRNAALYNLENGLGMKGYDPVAYFPEFGGEPVEGDPDISLVYGGVTYYFSSEDNKMAFVDDPARFESTYGGWCAWGMANEAFIEIDPTIYTLNGNRLHFFISRGAKARFDKDLQKRESDADSYWEQESGEKPRI